MPTYQYECSACGHAFEVLQSMTDKKLQRCPKCAKLKLFRLIGAGVGLIFKGSGFYITDYKKQSDSSTSDATPLKKESPVAKVPNSPEKKNNRIKSE